MKPSHPKSQTSNTIIKSYVIIVAGGSGTRMQSTIPKQFLLLNGRPLMMYTLEAFHNSSVKPAIILVLHPDHHAYWKELCIAYNFTIPHQVVAGGGTRFHSVQNGLKIVTEDEESLIAVHDAVRPLTSRYIIDASYQQASEKGNAITAVKSRDSVRQLTHHISISLLRDEIYLVQTPQTFQVHQLKRAYLQHFDPGFTDDASVVEKVGFDIHLSEGNYENIKVTFPEDIIIAEALLNKARN